MVAVHRGEKRPNSDIDIAVGSRIRTMRRKCLWKWSMTQ